jgi:hypothetical protein
VEAELKVIQNSYRLDSRCKAFIYMKQSSWIKAANCIVLCQTT